MDEVSPMLLSNLEYVPMRLARKFLFRDEFLLRFGALVPHYRVNRNQADPGVLVSDYARHLAGRKFDPAGRQVLEIGVGATNSTGYEFVARFAPARMWLLEPFVAFSAAADTPLRETIAQRHGVDPARLSAATERIRSLAAMPAASVDLVLSSSVLEHVADPAGLFRELRRVLRPGAAMLHLVDYRDHFFKYPYHFLQFSRRTWERWLNPGDLPRWRLYDHVAALDAAGFHVESLRADRDAAAFDRIASRVAADFRRDDPSLAVTYAVLWADHGSP